MQFPKKIDGPVCPKCRDNYLRYHGNNRTCLKCGHAWSMLTPPKPKPLTAMQILDRATRSGLE